MPKDAEPHYQLGLTLLEMGNIQGGAAEFQKAIQSNPRHTQAQIRLAELMSLNSNKDVVREAERRAEAILKEAPGNADALNALALAELRLEQPESAATHLQEALRKAPQHLSASMALAILKLKKNDLPGAEQVMLKSVAEAPRSVEHAFALGRFYAFLGRPADAEAQFRRALEIDSNYGPALAALGNALFRAGKTGEAEQVFLRASKLPDKEYQPLRAIFLLQTGKPDAAIAEFERQYKHDINNREARTRLVSAYLQVRRADLAERVLMEALKRNGKDVDALIQRGELFLLSGRYEQAQVDLTEVLRFRPDSADAHLILARIYRARGAVGSAKQHLWDALQHNPNLLAARVELAHLLTSSGAAKSALEVLDQTAEANKQNPAVIIERNLALYARADYRQMRDGIDRGLAISRRPELLLQDGILKMKQKEYARARTSFQEVLNQKPDEWRAVEALAISYVAENKQAAATAFVRQQIGRTPKSAAARYFLGAWLLQTGDLPGARSAFQAAKNLDVTLDEFRDDDRAHIMDQLDQKNLRGRINRDSLFALDIHLGGFQTVGKLRPAFWICSMSCGVGRPGSVECTCTRRTWSVGS